MQLSCNPIIQLKSLLNFWSIDMNVFDVIEHIFSLIMPLVQILS